MKTSHGNLSKDELLEVLTNVWGQYFYQLLYANYDSNYYDEDDLEKNIIEYDKLDEYFILTQDYFKEIIKQGYMTTQSFGLFEVLSTFKYLSKIYKPRKDKNKFIDLCSKMTNLLETIESVSR